MQPLTEEHVVLVHGIWMLGPDLLVLARRLRRAGFLPKIFRYRSLTRSPHDNAARLREAVLALDAPVVHLVGHSLGGLIMRLAVEEGGLPPGRMVTLGTPHRGSFVARRLSAGALASSLGRSEALLVQGLGRWSGTRMLGSIAGELPFGLGKLLASDLPPPHDGTVRVAETEAEGLAAHLVLRETHTGMLFSRVAAEQVATFLRSGRFT